MPLKPLDIATRLRVLAAGGLAGSELRKCALEAADIIKQKDAALSDARATIAQLCDEIRALKGAAIAAAKSK